MTWAALGLGAGILAGFALAEAVGAVDRKRVARAVARIGSEPPLPPLSPAAAARDAVLALARVPAFADVELEARGIGAGQIELTGWVPDRKRRALAERTVAALPGITAVVNRLLVESEDSDAPIAELSLEGQSA